MPTQDRTQNSNAAKPVIFDHACLREFIAGRLEWKRSQDASFSLRKACAEIGGVSPGLISRILSGARSITLDRAPLIARLLELSSAEREFFIERISSERAPAAAERPDTPATRRRASPRKDAPPHLLNDWIHPYVKDACSLRGPSPTAEEIHRRLGGIVPLERVRRSVAYLLREGFLRRDLKGRIVVNDDFLVTSDHVPSPKIRRFHRQALAIAQRGIESYPMERRRAQTLLLSLDEQGRKDLFELFERFDESLSRFAEDHPRGGESLFQITLHLTPIGGRNG